MSRVAFPLGLLQSCSPRTALPVSHSGPSEQITPSPRTATPGGPRPAWWGLTQHTHSPAFKGPEGSLRRFLGFLFYTDPFSFAPAPGIQLPNPSPALLVAVSPPPAFACPPCKVGRTSGWFSAASGPPSCLIRPGITVLHCLVIKARNPTPAVTNYHRLGSLKQQKFIPSPSW